MVRDTLNIKDLMSSVHFGNLPDTIEIISELPDVIHTELMLGSVHRWLEVSDYYKRPARIYAICENDKVEKAMINLVNCHNNLFITIIPKSRKEMLSNVGNGV